MNICGVGRVPNPESGISDFEDLSWMKTLCASTYECTCIAVHIKHLDDAQMGGKRNTFQMQQRATTPLVTSPL